MKALTISKDFNVCTESASLIYLFKMQTFTVFQERVSIESKSIKAAKIFKFISMNVKKINLCCYSNC